MKLISMDEVRMVKFGVHHGTNAPFLKFKIADIVESARLADKLGYDSIWVMDHLNWTPLSSKTEIQDAFVVLGHLADKIQTATLGTCVTDPHRRHPAQTALAALTMQSLTQGRFILGIGAGEGANLVDFGVPWNKSYTRLSEACRVIKLLWNSSIRKGVDFEGEFFQLKNAGLQFKVDTPPKLYLGANGPKTIQLAAELADGWIPTGVTPELYKQQLELFTNSSRNAEVEKGLEIWISISKDDPEFAKRVTRAVATNLVARKENLALHNIDLPDEIDLRKHYTEPVRVLTKHQNEVMNFVSKNVPDHIIESVVLAGTPTEVVEQLARWVKIGVEHFVFEFIGNYYDSLKLFAQEIMPHFKENKR
ncbi:MAG: LLM class flavin-dependent oxidoreductase [Candidatus Helarchaeota archaeon]